MDSIRLRNIRFFAHHGATERERITGQDFEVDVTLTGDFSRAARSDRLDDAIDYDKVYQAVAGIMTGERCNLLETLAERICTALMEKFPVQSARVTVRKPNPPVPWRVEALEATCERSRGG